MVRQQYGIDSRDVENIGLRGKEFDGAVDKNPTVAFFQFLVRTTINISDTRHHRAGELTPSSCVASEVSLGTHVGRLESLLLETSGRGRKCRAELMSSPQSSIRETPLKFRMLHGLLGLAPILYYNKKQNGC